jgi:glycosyltransferase involved in cell wall biosynthesis
LICADHSQKEFLEENGIRHHNMHVFLNLPNEAFFSRRPDRCTIPPLKLVFHGTFAERLGLDLTIQAAEKASEELDVSLTLIGKGDQERELKAYCRNRKLIDKLVVFKPAMAVESLQNELAQYDIGVIGNRRSLISERCMLPVKLLEYLYIGLPVIAPRLYVITKYFDDTMVEYYKPESRDDFAKKIVNLGRNASRSAGLVTAATVFFSNYNWESQRQLYLRLLCELGRVA